MECLRSDVSLPSSNLTEFPGDTRPTCGNKWFTLGAGGTDRSFRPRNVSLATGGAFVAGFLPEKRDDPVVRFETEPGQQMQVDILRSGDRVPGIIGF